MIIITDVLGRSEPLVTLSGLTQDKKLSGDWTLSFSVLSDQADAEAFDLIQEQSIIEFEGQEFVIKDATEKNVGVRSVKEVTAVHRIFEDLSKERYYETTSGAKTITQLMGIITNGTPYTFTVVDSFTSQTFENFGNDNHLSLFQTVLNRYRAEYELSGSLIIIRKQIGIESDFQFRYGYNVKSISKKIDSYGLATYIKGFGKPLTDAEGNETGQYLVQAEYTSPNAQIYGVIHAEPVYDKRIQDMTTLLRFMQERLQDYPEITIELDFADLRAAGYSYDVPGIGDSVLLIYEPLSNLNIDTRITGVTTEYDYHLKPIATKVELASMRKDITDTLANFSGTSKTVNKAINRDGSLTNDVLPQAVKDATRALESAQTEILFDRGIRLIDKDNPLLRVVLTSAGIGISFDGGVSYQTAMTGQGIAADVLTSGALNTNNVKIQGDTNFYWDGQYLIAQDPANANKFVRFSKNGLEVTTNGGTSFKTAINADGVVADSIRSTGTIDVATNMKVGTRIDIGQNFQDAQPKTLHFNGTGGGDITFIPAFDMLAISALNHIEFTSTFIDFVGTPRQMLQETGMCGVGGFDPVGTSGAVAGTYVQFKMKRATAPTIITLNPTSQNAPVEAIDITADGFWLFVKGTNTANVYKYWRGTYQTVN
ncbi:hypothetical protein EauS123_00050 [Exiguobacterium phage vB_EauS-123]|nr:hypothetical protein EauS123_00050 [Exiguobacterium phage vB_EauS-123]